MKRAKFSKAKMHFDVVKCKLLEYAFQKDEREGETGKYTQKIENANKDE